MIWQGELPHCCFWSARKSVSTHARVVQPIAIITTIKAVFICAKVIATRSKLHGATDLRTTRKKSPTCKDNWILYWYKRSFQQILGNICHEGQQLQSFPHQGQTHLSEDRFLWFPKHKQTTSRWTTMGKTCNSLWSQRNGCRAVWGVFWALGKVLACTRVWKNVDTHLRFRIT